MDFGVCEFYKIKGDRQYCTAGEEEVECLCAIPEAYCAHRDKNGKPRYPDLPRIIMLEKAGDEGHVL